jgi:replication-associated recombination protein RarA
MVISADDVKRLLQAQDDAVLVLIEGRTEVITEAETDSPQYRGALQVVSRRDLVKRTGGGDLSQHEIAEQAALLDTMVSELGG